MKTLQEISDRMEIEELFIRYGHAIDDGNFDDLDDVFLPGAVYDLTAFGGPSHTWPEMKSWLAEAMAPFKSAQHISVSSMIKVQGDEATARTVCINPLVVRDRGGADMDVAFCGLWYRDQLVRTPDGWRIKARVEERSWIFNAVEANMPVPPPYVPPETTE